MRIIYLLPLIFIFFNSCKNEYSGSTKYPLEQAHSHDHENDHKATPLNVKKPKVIEHNAEDESIYSSENRDSWQRPDLIVNHLGNLEGKTFADIGAGPTGYFSFIIAGNSNVEKVLAIDIDNKALKFMDEVAERNSSQLKGKIETRLASPSDPKIKEQEADVILISSTLTYIEDKISYLSKLKSAMPTGGRLVIVDYKMKELPQMFPSSADRIPLYEMEQIIDNSGFKRIVTDDLSLQFQYVIVALNP